MMSAPDQVQVDHPGASSNARPVGNSNSTTSSGAGSVLTDDGLSHPWTIGSYEGGIVLGGGNLSSPSKQAQQPAQRNSLVDKAGVRQGMTSPSTISTPLRGGAAIGQTGEATTLQSVTSTRSQFQDKLVQQPSAAVEAVLGAACETMGFDIAEVWLRTGPRTHQLINSHLRPTSLEDSVRNELIEVYYGERSSERTHRLSPALCKRAKEAMDVVWVTALTPHGAEALRLSINDVRTAVAIPISHAPSNTNLTVIFFSIRRIVMKPAAVEFLAHLSLAAGVASINSLAEDGLVDRLGEPVSRQHAGSSNKMDVRPSLGQSIPSNLSHSEHIPQSQSMVRPHRYNQQLSVTGGRLDLQWRQLRHVEYLTDGGNSWIHTAILDGRPVVVKTLKPECQDVVLAINEIESELSVHARLNHTNIVDLIGAGVTSKGVRFMVLERLDGGTLTQMLGYDTRIRDRRRRFWKKKTFAYADVLNCALAMAKAMKYCHEEAIPDCMVMHRDLKPDNIGFTLNGTVKIIDFGLAKIVEHASAMSDDVFEMSGETGSLRYMAPEVAESLPYNCKADVYSFGIILWEMNALKKPFEGLDRDQFYERVVHGGERPPLNRRWPEELIGLMTQCWDPDWLKRPKFSEIVARIEELVEREKGGGGEKKKSFRRIAGIIDRHSTWF